MLWTTDLGFGDDGQQPWHDGHQQGADSKDEVQEDVGDEGHVSTGEDSRQQIYPQERCISEKHGEKRSLCCDSCLVTELRGSSIGLVIPAPASRVFHGYSTAPGLLWMP